VPHSIGGASGHRRDWPASAHVGVPFVCHVVSHPHSFVIFYCLFVTLLHLKEIEPLPLGQAATALKLNSGPAGPLRLTLTINYYSLTEVISQDNND